MNQALICPLGSQGVDCGEEKEEADVGRGSGIRESGAESWDTNAITPGTQFMEKLGSSLHALCLQRGKGWSVSSASEPGEGEHKLYL